MAKTCLVHLTCIHTIRHMPGLACCGDDVCSLADLYEHLSQTRCNLQVCEDELAEVLQANLSLDPDQACLVAS